MTAAVRVVEQLPCPLEPAEVLLKGKQAAQLLNEISALEEQKKATSKRLQQEADDKRGQVDKLAEEIRTGEELRPVECYERPRYGAAMVDLIRTDTAAVVRSRPMHPSERQLAMDTGELSSPSKAKARKADNDNADDAH